MEQPEIRIEAYSSGRGPDWRKLALAFREFDQMMRQDPEEEARYQEWLAEYRKRKAG